MPYDCHYIIGFRSRLTSRAYGRLLAVSLLQFCIVFPLLNFDWNNNGFFILKQAEFKEWNEVSPSYLGECKALLC